jgi:hypothetical protein
LAQLQLLRFTHSTYSGRHRHGRLWKSIGVPAKPAPIAPVVDAAAQERACVDVLYQVTLLNQRQPVFKQAADDQVAR